MNKITSFKGKYAPLSNFYIGDDGYCLEMDYQASKADDRELFLKIISAKTPQEAKKLARGLSRKPDAIATMRKLVRFKFSALALTNFLLETKDAELIEGNWWHDTFWGVCDCPLHRGTGENHLGKILTEIRTEFKKIYGDCRNEKFSI